MVAPSVTAFTQRLYDSLPELYRTADAVQTAPDFPLLRWMALLGDQAGAIEEVADRIDAGDLTDPEIADAAWLPWLAQFVGVTLAETVPEAEARVRIETASVGWQAGTRAALAAEAKKALSGDGYVVVRPSPDDDWVIQLLVLPEEAPDPLYLVAAAITEAGAKPAGYRLDVIAYSPTWNDVDGLGTTFGDLDAQITTWNDVDSTGVS